MRCLPHRFLLLLPPLISITIVRPAGAFRLTTRGISTTTTTTIMMKARGGASSSSSHPIPAGRVAVVGGGIAGLACAKELQALGLSPIVFDTGVHAPGGRCSTRALAMADKKQRLLIDHSAQFLSVPADRAAAMAAADDGTRRWLEWVGEMEAKGLLREWDGQRIGTLQKGGRFTPRASSSSGERAMVGVGGMRSIPTFLAEGVQVSRPKWVSKVKPLADGKGWRLWHYQELIGVSSRGLCVDMRVWICMRAYAWMNEHMMTDSIQRPSLSTLKLTPSTIQQIPTQNTRTSPTSSSHTTASAPRASPAPPGTPSPPCNGCWR
jgi:hypothetical protein